MTTIKDVANFAGVSTATVSRALTDRPGVSSETRRRVRRSAKRLGYRPNAVARSLRVERTRTLGLVVSDVMNPFFTELARAVEDEARAAGYAVILGNADESALRQDECVEVLLDRRVDGLLLSPTVGGSALIKAAVREGHPVVFVDRAVEGLDVPSVRADGARATRALVDHLVALDHRRLAIISGPEDTVTGRERRQAFTDAVAAHRLELPDPYVEIGDFQASSGHDAMIRLLGLPSPPSAVFAADNLMALGALQAAREMGRRVPDDVAIACFDDTPWLALLDPPLTAIAQPIAQLGRTAVRALLDRMAGRRVASQMLDCHLVVRRSCGEPATLAEAEAPGASG